MQKRIFRQMALLSCAGILLVSMLLCVIFYRQLTDQARADLRERTQIFAVDHYEGVLDNLMLVEPGDMRVTVISPGGAVLFDNMADPQKLEDHLEREEIGEALELGAGESRRFSDTLGLETYYVAIRLTDGTVLRTAKTVDSIWRMFMGVLPVIAAAIGLLVIAAHFVAGGLARRVVSPIGRVDLSGEPKVPYDELAPFARAIAQQRRQLRQDGDRLRQRTETVNAIMDNMAEGVVLLDRRGMVLSVNKSAAAIFGVREPIEGHSALELLRDVEFGEQLRRALGGDRGEMLLEKDKREFRVLVSPVAELGVAVFVLDLTDRSRAEKMRREFSANVSHELKTPLTSICGNAELLCAGLVRDADRPLFYEKIKNEAARLMALIEDIMLLSELDEESMQAHHETVSLAELAQECAGALAQKAAEHQVSLSVEGGGAMWGNRHQLYEMFYNLLDNGIKYNKPGGSVGIGISQSGKETAVTVTDTGIGISDGDRERIFERFYRADKSRSKKSGGTGLGLAIVKHIVALHSGEIQVTGRPEGGTVFTVRFRQ